MINKSNILLRVKKFNKYSHDVGPGVFRNAVEFIKKNYRIFGAGTP